MDKIKNFGYNVFVNAIAALIVAWVLQSLMNTPKKPTFTKHDLKNPNDAQYL